MLRRVVGHVLKVGGSNKQLKRILNLISYGSQGSNSAGLKQRRFFDPKEELLYKSNQAKTRMYSRFHQSF